MEVRSSGSIQGISIADSTPQGLSSLRIQLLACSWSEAGEETVAVVCLGCLLCLDDARDCSAMRADISAIQMPQVQRPDQTGYTCVCFWWGKSTMHVFDAMLPRIPDGCR